MHSPDHVLLRGGRLLAAEALRFPVTPSGLHHTLPGLGLPDIVSDHWRLVVGGHTHYALGLSLPGLQRRPHRTADVVLQTPGLPGAASQACWTGTPLAAVLDEAAPLGGPCHVLFEALDRGVVDGAVRRGQLRLSLDAARSPDVLLAWAMNGEPLSLEHGYPLRLLVPGREERASLRWLSAISIIEGPLPEGSDPAPLGPRALLEPPGLLEQETGRYVIEAGQVTLRGRAWTGGDLRGVEVATDGEAWRPAALAETPRSGAWTTWTAPWAPGPGVHRLGSRALDERGTPGEASFLTVAVRD